MIPYRTILQTTAERSRLHTFLLCCGIIGSALFAIVNFSFSAVSPDYDVARQSIGELALGEYGWIQSANFMVTGVFLCAFAIGLRKELVSGTGAAIIPVLQIVLGLIMLSLGVFPVHAIHRVLLLVLFASIMLNFFVFSRRFAADQRWAHWAAYTNITAIVLLIFFALYVRSNLHHGAYTGIYQRGV
ncbi:MAG: DUF998 domain-containing protein, partial [Bacteroidetes bacterium]|nr:DUF998 domain-containing protein [Bacteroidota bacterium]